MDVVRCDHVTRRFGAARALNDVSFTVAKGEIFCMVGPRGAGKTTLIECLTGTDRPTEGTIKVFDTDPATRHRDIAGRLGVQPQHPSLMPHLSVAETLRFFSAMHNDALPWQDLLESLGLSDEKRTKVRRLTVEQQQKISLALSFLHQPELLILDEPTAGLQPQDQQDMWEALNTMCDYGTTIFLATQDLNEVEQLCDRVGVMDRGELLTTGTVPGLIRGCVGESAAFLSLDQPAGTVPNLTELAGVTRIVPEGLSLTVYGQGGFVHRILAHLAAHGIQVTTMNVTEPKFADVFFNLTGRSFDEAAA